MYDSDVLETVLYYSSGQEEELAAGFYGQVLGLRAVGRSRLDVSRGRIAALLFDAGLSSFPSRNLLPHGARGPIHTCFVAGLTNTGDWKQHVIDGQVDRQEIEWDKQRESFYFHDPAGNACWRSPTAAISGRRS